MREIQFNHSIKLFFSRNAFHMVTHFQKSNFFHFLKLSVKTYEPSNFIGKLVETPTKYPFCFSKLSIS